MSKPIGYYFLIAATWPMQLFPLEAHYRVSDFLTFWIFRVFRYRRTVVEKNLKLAFPEKSDAERYSIMKQFYRNLCDIFIETLYITHINLKKNEHRLVIENREVIDRLISEKKSIICLSAHFGNWEFVSMLVPQISQHIYFVFKKLNNKTFDYFYKRIREKFGGHALEMSETVRQLLIDTKEKRPFFAYLIADQRPHKKENAFWLPFLGQDTPVLTGPEKIAQKTSADVIWIETRRQNRGQYRIQVQQLTEPGQTLPEHEITRKFMKLLEESIHQNPDQWLWSHNRWKHKRDLPLESEC